jgi:lipoate-protein ligase A
LPSSDTAAGALGALPIFGFVARHDRPLPDGTAQEAAWMERAAATGRAAAHLWHGEPGLVVPRSYERSPRWAQACTASAAAGWPVQVRSSGGGLVPQGPGVLNLSLCWPVADGQRMDIDLVYRAFCAELAMAFWRLGLATHTATVAGSFCDGRYNLAVGAAKLVGTAQCWRRLQGVQVVLAHALVLVDADLAALAGRCNHFEVALGHERRYRAEAVTSVAQAWPTAHAGAAAPADLSARTAQVLAEQFARVLPPRVQAA